MCLRFCQFSFSWVSIVSIKCQKYICIGSTAFHIPSEHTNCVWCCCDSKKEWDSQLVTAISQSYKQSKRVLERCLDRFLDDMWTSITTWNMRKRNSWKRCLIYWSFLSFVGRLYFHKIITLQFIKCTESVGLFSISMKIWFRDTVFYQRYLILHIKTTFKSLLHNLSYLYLACNQDQNLQIFPLKYVPITITRICILADFHTDFNAEYGLRNCWFILNSMIRIFWTLITFSQPRQLISE